MTIKSPFLSQFLIAVALTGCGPRDSCDNCAAWGDLVDACLEEWVEEYKVVPDCVEEYDSAWFDDMGLLKSDDSEIFDAYLAASSECTSGDEAYTSCKARQSVSREVAEAAGNGVARVAACEESAERGVDLAIASLDCRGYLVALGIEEPE
jgi:hypothetical protein